MDASETTQQTTKKKTINSRRWNVWSSLLSPYSSLSLSSLHIYMHTHVANQIHMSTAHRHNKETWLKNKKTQK